PPVIAKLSASPSASLAVAVSTVPAVFSATLAAAGEVNAGCEFPPPPPLPPPPLPEPSPPQPASASPAAIKADRSDARGMGETLINGPNAQWFRWFRTPASARGSIGRRAPRAGSSVH